MKSKQAGRLAAALSVMLLSLSGCGGASDQPDLGQVSGTITFDGKPLSGIVVVFQPDSGRPARGRTDAEGKYELTYIRNTRGTKVGHNRVEIAPSEEDDAPAEAQLDADSAQAQRPFKSGKPKIPVRYNIKSELEAEVQPGDNTFDFALTS
ncbi:Ig-like domain-containing protein [Blastopirellula sp. JC732]|uniref:Ig-like domain-containing protein n=1 Tax=Blastopirellula sediminis TaxID=2894196 RepID=A0A9X1MKG8_9BACT|nr:Ig-like domain-containing protein [Blastopirellula sediminis]MCC9609261.1 Ig-like domain-containing protein [Blastopirellula sediminis]MCC9627962.1 Ig-like domain-containing protein [Blastopirellula sediminis]